MDFKMFKQIDWVLVGTVIAIFLIGIVVISSATHINEDGDLRQIQMQSIAFIIGAICIFITLLVDYNIFGKYYKELYILSILLLLMVYIPGLGVKQAGARSWIKLGPVFFQTSEAAKLTFILSYGKFLEDKKDKLNSIKEIIPAVLYPMPILFLLLIQPDLGSTIVVASIVFGMLFICGINYKIIGYSALTGFLSIPLVYPFLKPHQKVRIDAFLHPGNPNYEGNFQVIQSMIAIGSGKIFGKGLYKGTQNQYNFLPVQESDFIFAVLGEELGLVMGVILILLFLIFLRRILKISKESKDFYGTLISMGVLFMFFYQIVQNIGMTIGLMPVTGVTLPFVSYGGSSLVISMLSLAIVLNVCMRKKKINF